MRRQCVKRTSPILAVLLIAGTGTAQIEPDFEAASVRPSPTRARAPALGVKKGGPGTSDPGRIIYEGVPLMKLLMDAWEVSPDQISGPDWAATRETDVRYDVQATLPPGASPEQVASMLGRLLMERLNLSVHHQPKQVQGYSLVVAKSGLKIRESVGPDAESEHITKRADGGFSPNSFEADGFPRLFPGRNYGGTMKNGAVLLRFRDSSMSLFADKLAYALATRVRDATALQAKYDFTFEFSPPERGQAAVRAYMPLPGDRKLILINPPDASQLDCAPILSSALEKQLGLRLQAEKLTVDTLVIDHADKMPKEN